MALVQANGQTGLCRRFLSHLEEIDCRLLTGLCRKGKKEKFRRLQALIPNFGVWSLPWDFSGAEIVGHVREGTR